MAENPGPQKQAELKCSYGANNLVVRYLDEDLGDLGSTSFNYSSVLLKGKSSWDDNQHLKLLRLQSKKEFVKLPTFLACIHIHFNFNVFNLISLLIQIYKNQVDIKKIKIANRKNTELRKRFLKTTLCAICYI